MDSQHPAAALIALRPLLQKVLQEITKFPRTVPPNVPADALASVTEAAEAVRAARRALSSAESDVARQQAEIRELAADDASDDELREANERLHSLELTVTTCRQRIAAREEQQEAAVELAREAAADAHEADRLYCTSIFSELTGPTAGDSAPRPTVGFLISSIKEAVDTLARELGARCFNAEMREKIAEKMIASQMERPAPAPTPGPNLVRTHRRDPATGIMVETSM
jgi:hypothetical protein